MEVRKVLRKAAAVAASASFIGATLLGAVAQDLANYPAPFVKDGTFDAFIVVGENAQTEDVVGAIDVGSSLQFALKKETKVSAGAASASISEGYKVQKSGDLFNYGDDINSVQDGTSVTEEDLPFVLGDGKFVESEGDNKNSETYTQELNFNTASTATMTFAQDDDLAPKAGDYLLVDKNTELYNYTLEFDSAIEYNNASDADAQEDLKTSTLTIQGKTYTITDVDVEAGAINKLTLLSGEAVLWLTQNNPITKTVSGVEHTIEVLDVTENEDACQVKVDDVTAIIDEDETRVVNGVQVGVTDVRAIHAQLQDVDVCQVSVGASEVVIENGKEVKVDDEDLEGSDGTIVDNGGQLESISVVYTPKDQEDDVYLAKGQAFTDPIFSSWKIAYGGAVADYETYSVKTSGDNDATFKFINNDGKEVELPLYFNDTLIFLGDGNDVDERVYAAGLNTSITANTCAGTTSVEDCEGMRILATTAGGEAHLFEIQSIDTTENTTDIKDLTYGRTHSDIDFVPETNSTLDLSTFGTTLVLNLSYVNNKTIIVSSIPTKIETNAQGSVDIDDSLTTSNVSITISETNRAGGDDIADEKASTSVTITAQPDSDDEIELDASAAVQFANVESEEDSDYQVIVTAVGTKVTVDDENGNSVVVEVPREEVYGSVFVAPLVAELTTAEGGVSAYTISKLNVGAAKLDSEISSVGANNLIVVGGPCANKVAAQVMGLTYPACGASSGIAQDSAVIKTFVQSSGKVSLVVAGWNAVDTKRATRVLANYDSYDLSGSSVEVTGTSLTDIQVKKSA
ncbi:MAG TPA: hypothetical protein VKE88_02650 [Candidatus Nanoarchaeia archaeon]|nr:hypothetical protein [Candidatus Nanoarchaeia archaeon]